MGVAGTDNDEIYIVGTQSSLLNTIQDLKKILKM